MTQFPPDDQPLVDFLRQHRPVPPPPAPNLEQQLLATIRDTPPQRSITVLERPSAAPVSSRRSPRAFWLIPPAIAAGLLVTWTTQRFLVPAGPSPAEVSSLEAFMESNWQGSITREPEFDPVNPASND